MAEPTFVCLYLDYLETFAPYSYEERGRIVTAMLEFAAEESLPCLDMHPIWLDHRVEGAKNFGMGDWLYDEDRCHPGDVGHEAFGQALLKFMFG